jgi:hypothetical protein
MVHIEPGLCTLERAHMRTTSFQLSFSDYLFCFTHQHRHFTFPLHFFFFTTDLLCEQMRNHVKQYQELRSRVVDLNLGDEVNRRLWLLAQQPIHVKQQCMFVVCWFFLVCQL